MRKTFAALALTASLAAGGATLIAPSAFAADSATSTATASPSTSIANRAAARVTAIRTALKGRVTDGTITQAQADKVATTLSTSDALRGPGGRGDHGRHAGHLGPDAVAKVLDISTDQLRTQEQAGKTLAQIAGAQGISKADLISKLVVATKTQLAADVKAGTITPAQADSVTYTLTAEVTERVDKVHMSRGDHDGAAAPSSTAPSSTTTAAPSASTTA